MWGALVGLLGCDEPPQQGFGSFLSGASTQYAQAVPDTQLTFPTDHGAHRDFRHEWWYLTANLKDKDGNPFGVQWTQFRFAVAAQPPIPSGSWSSQQIYMAHSAVTMEDKHYADEKWSRGQPKLAGVELDPLRVFVDDWQWRSQSRDLFPATLKVHSGQFSYALTLESSAPYHLQGIQGYSKKSANGAVASHYYSQPFIDVSGEVRVDGQSYQVKGKGWIDREWSSQFLLDSQQGWDWFALHLNDDLSLVVFQLRQTKASDHGYAHARLMYRNGQSRAIEQQEIKLRATEYTQIQGRDYPTQWALDIESQQINLRLSALNVYAKMPLTIPYWEGPIRFEGSHSGLGYMELTGY
nr:lipocalin-like domain-containing protein [Vibrio ostreicida]